MWYNANVEFCTTIGHEKQKELFLRAYHSGTLSHTYALVGPENIGKTTFALEFAKIAKAQPILDVFLADSEEGLSIEEARVMQNRLNMTPVGDLKIAIISYAEKMTLSAANALLKILEEPPARSLVFLITSNFYQLLPTIASRLQRINFTVVSDGLVKESLRAFSLDEEKLREIIELSSGRIGLAKRLISDINLFNFFQEMKRHYKILEKGELLKRLQSAQRLASLEEPKIVMFLKFAMHKWVDAGGELMLGKKLQEALKDLSFNLNTKLVLDNLFLPC